MTRPHDIMVPMAGAEGLLGEITHGLEWIAVGIDLIGIAIILLGFVVSLVGLALCLASGVGLRKDLHDMHRVRVQLGTYILVGIEFMIASDIIHTVLTRELEDLAFVAALVAIRTAISFFLGRELMEVRHEHDEDIARTREPG